MGLSFHILSVCILSVFTSSVLSLAEPGGHEVDVSIDTSQASSDSLLLNTDALAREVFLSALGDPISSSDELVRYGSPLLSQFKQETLHEVSDLLGSETPPEQMNRLKRQIQDAFLTSSGEAFFQTVPSDTQVFQLKVFLTRLESSRSQPTVENETVLNAKEAGRLKDLADYYLSLSATGKKKLFDSLPKKEQLRLVRELTEKITQARNSLGLLHELPQHAIPGLTLESARVQLAENQRLLAEKKVQLAQERKKHYQAADSDWWPDMIWDPEEEAFEQTRELRQEINLLQNRVDSDTRFVDQHTLRNQYADYDGVLLKENTTLTSLEEESQGLLEALYPTQSLIPEQIESIAQYPRYQNEPYSFDPQHSGMFSRSDMASTVPIGDWIQYREEEEARRDFTPFGKEALEQYKKELAQTDPQGLKELNRYIASAFNLQFQLPKEEQKEFLKHFEFVVQYNPKTDEFSADWIPDYTTRDKLLNQALALNMVRTGIEDEATARYIPKWEYYKNYPDPDVIAPTGFEMPTKPNDFAVLYIGLTKGKAQDYNPRYLVEDYSSSGGIESTGDEFLIFGAAGLLRGVTVRGLSWAAMKQTAKTAGRNAALAAGGDLAIQSAAILDGKQTHYDLNETFQAAGLGVAAGPFFSRSALLRTGVRSALLVEASRDVYDGHYLSALTESSMSLSGMLKRPKFLGGGAQVRLPPTARGIPLWELSGAPSEAFLLKGDLRATAGFLRPFRDREADADIMRLSNDPQDYWGRLSTPSLLSEEGKPFQNFYLIGQDGQRLTLELPGREPYLIQDANDLYRLVLPEARRQTLTEPRKSGEETLLELYQSLDLQHLGADK